MGNTCFLCLTASNETTTVDSENHEICQQIEDCLQLKVSFNGKAASICKDCKNSLSAAHEFFIKVHKAQLTEHSELDLKLSTCDKEAKTLTLLDEKSRINNNCIQSLEEVEREVKEEPNEFEEEKSDESVDEEEEDVFNEDSSEKEEKEEQSNALAVIKNWKSYPWYCYLCVYSTSNFSTLIGHIKTKHDINDMKKIQYQCVDCTKKLSSYTLFLNHVRQEHQPGLRLCCDICSECFSDNSSLGAHRCAHNEEQGIQQPLVFHCMHCTKVFPSRQTINSHVLTHEKALQCQECTKSFQRLKYLKRHMEMHKELKYKCGYCTKTFHRNFNKISHERTHTLERPYKCDQCDKMFRFQSTLKSHQRTHSKDRLFKCDQCSSSFNQSYTLKEHMRKHTKENPFSCDECQKVFRYRKSWRRHMQRHADEKEVKTKEPSKRAKKAETTTSKAKQKKASKK